MVSLSDVGSLTEQGESSSSLGLLLGKAGWQFTVPVVGGTWGLADHNPRREPASFQVVSFTMTLALPPQRLLLALALGKQTGEVW